MISHPETLITVFTRINAAALNLSRLKCGAWGWREGGAYLRVAFVWKLDATKNCINYDIIISVLTGRALINFFLTDAALNGERTALIWVRYITIGEAVKQHFPVVHCITLHSQGDFVSRLTMHLKAIVSSTFRLYVILRYKKPFQLLTSTSWWKSVVTAEKRAFFKKVKLSCLKVSCWKQNKYIAPAKRTILQPSPNSSLKCYRIYERQYLSPGQEKYIPTWSLNFAQVTS